MAARNAAVAALYQQVKDVILERIESGEWKPNERVMSENDFVQEMNVSRMTVNRALRELADEGILVRLPGVGTFVGDRRVHGHFLEFRNIADEIREEGHTYSAEVDLLKVQKASADMARAFGMRPGQKIYHSVVVHFENDLPLQLEDRWVNPVIAPNYHKADFTKISTYEYLMNVAPLPNVEHSIRAVIPEVSIRRRLNMGAKEPCLLIDRRTRVRGTLASIASLYHPGSRFELYGRFSPKS